MTLASFAHSEVLAPFFLLVGMQLRSEITHVRQILLPTIAAIGGMLFPALIYAVMNRGTQLAQAWPVVMPTDIALVMVVLLLLGKKVSIELKTFMLAIAVADDLLSIVVLAAKYSSALKPMQVFASIGAVAIGVLIWKVPHQIWLTRFVNFFILPIYIFANLFPTLTKNFVLTSHLGGSIVLARVVGKAIGIVLFTWVAVKFRLARRPSALQTGEVLGGAILAGMGLAVSFFIADLAFTDPALLDQARAGLLIAALISALAGSAVLTLTSRKRPNTSP
ncbi:MAG: Na+/H+ antiporter NhaA [Actinobacteria bacterium]|nr:Na+/H+ antiporter NhaA [Actinomycetota bacterium]